MNAYSYMKKHMKGVYRGIGWITRVFARPHPYTAAELIDAAVDIAWEQFPAEVTQRPDLEITHRHGLIVFRLPAESPVYRGAA